jgi:hypothetical protein
MTTPKLRVVSVYNPVLIPETKLAMDALQASCIKKARAMEASKSLAWSTNLTSDKPYRLCPDGCGLVFMSRHNKGEHLDPAEMDADWKDEEPQDGEAFTQAPVELPLKPAVSVAQVMWARDMVAQYPRKTKEQICRENGGISWEQLQHYAQTPTEGLPERKGQKSPAPKAQAKPAMKPVKAKPSKKAKGT